MLSEQLVSVHISLMLAVTILYCKTGKRFQLITKCIFVCIPLLLPNYKMSFFTLLVLFIDSLPALHMTNLSQTKDKRACFLGSKEQKLAPKETSCFSPMEKLLWKKVKSEVNRQKSCCECPKRKRGKKKSSCN